MVNEEFDKWADSYTKVMEDFVPHYRKMLTAIVEYLPAGFQPGQILDLGCGNGNATAMLLSQFPDAQYTLLDASEEMLKLCQERFKDKKIDLIPAYMQEASFAENRYDLIVASFSFHHLDGAEKRQIFNKLPVWLNKNGIFMYTDLMVNHQDKSLHDPFMKDWEAYARSNGKTDEDWNWMADHHAKYDKPDDADEQMEWLEAAGFEQVEKPWHVGYWTCLTGTGG